MPLAQLGQFALPVSNADRSEAFYADSLGLRKLFRVGDLVFFDCAGVRLMLEGTAGAVQPAAAGVHYFKVKGIEDTFEELAGRGVQFVDRPHRVAQMPDHELWMTFFKDPDGHLLALMEEKR